MNRVIVLGGFVGRRFRFFNRGRGEVKKRFFVFIFIVENGGRRKFSLFSLIFFFVFWEIVSDINGVRIFWRFIFVRSFIRGRWLRRMKIFREIRNKVAVFFGFES